MNRACIVPSMVACGMLVGVTATLAAPPTAGKGPNMKAVADTLIHRSAGIRPGELVLINGGTRDQELLENLAVETRRIGAHPIITLGSDRLSRLLVTEVPARFDAEEPAFQLKLAETVDAVITVDYHERPDAMADVPAARLAAIAQAKAPIDRTLLKRGVIQVNLGNGLSPTASLARQFGISQDDLRRIFWHGVNVDYDKLQATGEQVRTVLASGRELHITSPDGTDLTVEIAQRPVFVSDGVISPEDRYAGGPACQVWLPAGEVYVAPVPGTARGTFVARTFFFEGRPIEDLTLEFKDGVLIGMSSPNDISALRERFEAAPARRDLFGAVDIGINPNIKAPAGSSLITWMGAGTISIGIGNNAWAGGDNDVPYGLYAHILNGTATLDGRTKIVDKGMLTVGK